LAPLIGHGFPAKLLTKFTTPISTKYEE